ncbi:MAG: sigma 54-interacting transcriptional regulator [Polyangiaceae bacterium]|nr:sigma 54-interacting transcriptional regulator [Polyangiaceae bacterium]
MWDGGLATIALPASGVVRVGRGSECDARIDHASVSRRHAALHIGEAVIVEDLGSHNGTRVDGRTLRRGERVEIGGTSVVEVGAALLILQRAAPAVAAASAAGADADAMSRVNRLIDLVARGQIGVLLLGETGVGKEVLAERLHRSSPRAAAPLVRINCAALPEALLESELFGYEKGAFTGAHGMKRGLLEGAQGGTVLLDEIGDVPLPTQAKLLRAIEAREVTRLGGTQPRPIDVRFVSATNRDLGSMVGAGSFRADLLYRLAGVTVRVPPLRERVSEISGLATRFVGEAAARLGRAPPSLAPPAIAWLERQPWPGNIRELRNAIECAVLLCGEGPIRATHFPAAVRPPAAPGDDDAGDRRLRDDLAVAERSLLVQALAACNGNQTRAAEKLGISRRMLLYRIETHGLPRPRKRDG